MIRLLYIAFLLWASTPLAWAVATVTSSGTTYKTTEPTNATVTNWTAGWYNTTGETGITGWDYVGSIGGASAVYLGDGWVLTAAHVTLTTSSTFTLGNVGYAISDITYLGNSDLAMFKISVSLSLPALTITGTDSLISVGSRVVLIGNGGGAESWGMNTITNTNLSVSVSSFTTIDFATKLGSGQGYTNTALLVNGDSGGAAFYYDSTSKTWVLVGINEAVATDTNGNSYSCMVDLSKYADEIQSVMLTAVPEPSVWALLLLGGAAVGGTVRFRRR